uniref:Protein arginine N-methyltransferase 9 n=1 Tax=Heterorhabditis bacteriophora TaxID=37862 RepID=A0A1I7XJX8_HETBA
MKFSLYLARKFAIDRDWEQSLRHYLTVLVTFENTIQREREFSEEFRIVLENWINHNNDEQRLCTLIAPIIRLFPKCVPIITLLADVSARCDQLPLLPYLKMSLFAESNDLMGAVFRVTVANVRSQVFDQWHMAMINDRSRNEKFAEALRRCVKRGDSILDIGTGTGLLTVIAARQANIVVAEILDCCAFGEGIIETFLDAHLRLTIEKPIFIPSLVTVYATLVESPLIYQNHAYTSQDGMEYRSEYVRYNGEDQEEPYWCAQLSDYEDVRILSSMIPLLTVDFNNSADLAKYLVNNSDVARIPVIKKGLAHCIVVHFRAVLVDNVIIDTSEGTCWDQGIFPLATPIMNKGDNRQILVRNQYDFRVINNRNLYSAISTKFPMVLSKSWNMSEVFVPAEFQHLIDFRHLPNILVSTSTANEEVVESSGKNNDLLEYSDGSIDEVFLQSYTRIKQMNLLSDSPLRSIGLLTDSLTARGCLISSSRLSYLTRAQISSLCGVQLSSINNYTLFEYRDIDPIEIEYNLYINSLDTFSHLVCSEDFDIIDLGHDDTNLMTRTFEVRSTVTATIEGVLYWWQMDNYSTKQDRCAAFIFKDVVVANKGDLIRVTCDVYCGSMLISGEKQDVQLDCNSISHR